MSCTIKITNSCGLECSYCYAEKSMDTCHHTRITIDNDLVDLHKHKSINITGGDPLLVGMDKLKALIKELRIRTAEAIPIYLHTNATLWTSEHSYDLAPLIEGVTVFMPVYNYELLIRVATIINSFVPVRLDVPREVLDAHGEDLTEYSRIWNIPVREAVIREDDKFIIDL